MSIYGSLCDDFGVSVHLASKIEMPSNRETILHFFEAVRRQLKKPADFERREGGEFLLEEDRESNSYSWVSLDHRRLAVGAVNPESLDDVDALNTWILNAAPVHLGLTGLDTDSLDVMYYFDFLYTGNHDEVVAEALASGGPLDGFARMGGEESKLLSFQPSITVALDKACQLQCRVSVESRTTAYQVRTNSFTEIPISVYATMRQFWVRQQDSFADSYHKQRSRLDDVVAEFVIPNVVQPLARVISTKQ